MPTPPPSYSFSTEATEYGVRKSYYLTSQEGSAEVENLHVKGTLQVDGTTTMGSTLTVSAPANINGLITTNGGLDCTSGSSITVPGGNISAPTGTITANAILGLTATTPVLINDGVQNSLVLCGYRFTWGQTTLGTLQTSPTTETGTITLTTPFFPSAVAVTLANTNIRTVELQLTGGGTTLNWTANFPASSAPIPIVMFWMAIAKA